MTEKEKRNSLDSVTQVQDPSLLTESYMVKEAICIYQKTVRLLVVAE